jgi:NDP-sugar pyrophosphorylase family protein
MAERVTITIRKDLLRRIDNMVDGSEIRNRSHAIEGLLSKSLTSEMNTALIMAGGREDALVMIGGRTIMEHQIDMLKTYGIEKIIIAAGSNTDMLRQRFGGGKAYGVEIIYLEEEKPMGTAGAIGLAGDYIDGSFAMLNVDTLMDPDLGEIYEFHKKHRKLATVMLATTDDPSNFGVVKMRGNQIIKFIEKPKTSAETSRLVNAGLCIFEKKVCGLVPKRKIMIEELFNRLCRQSQLMGFLHDGKSFDIGTKEGYERAMRDWKIDY